MLEPVEYASSSSIKSYSFEHHIIISSQKRLKCIITKEMQLIVNQLLKAISVQTRISMKYHVPNKPAALEVENLSPVFAFFFDGGMYLQALLEDGTLRTYAIERIETVCILNGTIALKPDFNPSILLTDPFGPFIGRDRVEAKVWIAPEQVPYVKERKWSDGVTISDNEDGSAIFKITTYGEWAFVNWILSMRTQAKLIEPEWLRNKVSVILDQTAALYHTP